MVVTFNYHCIYIYTLSLFNYIGGSVSFFIHYFNFFFLNLNAWGAHDRSLPFYGDLGFKSGRGGCKICGYMTLAHTSHTPSISYILFAFPHTSHICSCPHCLHPIHDAHNFISFLLWDPWSMLSHERETTIN